MLLSGYIGFEEYLYKADKEIGNDRRDYHFHITDLGLFRFRQGNSDVAKCFEPMRKRAKFLGFEVGADFIGLRVYKFGVKGMGVYLHLYYIYNSLNTK